MADSVLTLHSFQASEYPVPNVYEDFTGVMEVKKLTNLNILSARMPAVLSYLFTRKRRKLHIEQLYLPPEKSRSLKKESQTQEPKKNEKKREVKQMMCTPGGKPSELDF